MINNKCIYFYCLKPTDVEKEQKLLLMKDSPGIFLVYDISRYNVSIWIQTAYAFEHSFCQK